MTNEEELLNNKTSEEEEVSQSCCNSGGKSREILYFYLLLPTAIASLFSAGLVWVLTYPDFVIYFNLLGYIRNAFLFSFSLYILYFLLLLLRSFYGKPLSGKNKIISFVVFFSIWAYIDAFYFEHNGFVKPIIGLGSNAEPIAYVTVVLFVVAVLKACFVILTYDGSKHSAKIDLISCAALSVVYIVIFNFIKEGGLIFLLLFSEY